jgi:argininosuccinate synthase
MYKDSVESFLAPNALGPNRYRESRFIGGKSRGCYESLGATILCVAHIDLEGLTLEHTLRDQFVTPRCEIEVV